MNGPNGEGGAVQNPDTTGHQNLPIPPAVQPQLQLSFQPPIITANMLPKPNPSPDKQSPEDWFKLFSSVAESFIAIYREAHQEVVGQRQALATIPSLLNRNESEQRLATRIIQECTTIAEAKELVIRTVGNLENECQASEHLFNVKRGTKSIEDFYAILLEKDKTSKLGRTFVIKKLIAEMPENTKPSLQRKFSEARRTNPRGELPTNIVDELYEKARKLFNDKNKNSIPEAIFLANNEKSQKLEEQVNQQSSIIKELQEQLDTFMVKDDNQRPRCHYCDKPGHLRRDCWHAPENQRRGDYGGRQQRGGGNVSRNVRKIDHDQTLLEKNDIIDGAKRSKQVIEDKSAPNVFCTFEGNDTSVLVGGSINGKKVNLLIDTGAGPCVIDIWTLKRLGKDYTIDPSESGNQLSGLGNAKIIGTVKLEVILNPHLKQTQVFKVIEDIGGTILIGRRFLSKFKTLQINWKEMTLKINDVLVKGKDVIQGGSLDSRAFIASEDPPKETNKTKIHKKVATYEHLTSHQKRSLSTLLLNNSDIFIENTRSPPKAHLVSHVIDTQKNLPVRDKMRRFSPDTMSEIEKQINEMVENGICRPSNSPWSSQVLLAKKKDGTMRFIVDYRKLNDITVRDDYPIPNMKDLIDDIKGSKFFTCMDMPSAYWHIPMEEDSIAKSAFQIPKGKYEMLRMGYGLKNGQATQQRFMDETLKAVPNTSAYIDNIFTHSKRFDEHIEYLKICFEQLKKNNLSLRIDKCDFAQFEVEQFGLTITGKGIRPSLENVTKIKNYPRPNCLKELKRFLGMTNYYREFIARFAEIAEPLQELNRKGTIYTWTNTREESFRQLKEAISAQCLLNIPDWTQPFVIELDGSKISAGAVLLQELDGVQKILGFHSSTLDSAQKNYSATELECWAAISSCRRFRHYIKGAHKVILRADHEPLQWLRKQSDPRGKFSRWIMELEQYEYNFEYKPGKSNIVPDALSRVDMGRSETDEEDSLEDGIYHVADSSIKEGIYYVKRTPSDMPPDWKDLLRKEQRREPSINIAIEQLEQNNKINQGRFKYFKQLSLQDDLLTKSGRIVVPNSLKFQITKDFHQENHWGIQNTLVEISKEYYWPNMKVYIEQYCASCATCLQTKHQSKKPKAELKPIEWSDYEPCQAIALDIATMTNSYDGFSHILLITDCMSKFTELCPIRNMTAESVTKNIKRNWIARHGIPVTLLTDQGSQVDGVDVRKLCDELGISKRRSSPYHPEGDGISERPIGVMKGLFRRKLFDKKIAHKRWTDLLPEVQLAMNNKTHAATKYSPFQLLYGELRNTNNEERAYIKKKYVDDAQNNLRETANRMKSQYDKHSSVISLKVGDQVYVKRNFVRKGVSKKLSTMFHDLSVIVESKHPVYRVKSNATKQEKWVHHNRLRKKGYFENSESIPKIYHRSQNTKDKIDQKESDQINELPQNNCLLFLPTQSNEGGRGITNHISMNIGNEDRLSNEMKENESHNDDDPIPLETITHESTDTELLNEELVEEPTGRVYNENGCLVSARRSKKKTSDDFVYTVYYV